MRPDLETDISRSLTLWDIDQRDPCIVNGSVITYKCRLVPQLTFRVTLLVLAGFSVISSVTFSSR